MSKHELPQRRSVAAADLPRTLLHAILAAFSSAASADRSAWCSAIAVSYGPLTPQQVLVLARQHKLPALVVDGDRGDHDAVVALRLQAGDRERRVQGVPGVHLDQEGAGLLKEADEHLADEVREQGGSRCGESQHLEAMHNRRNMTVLARPLGVVVHRVIVHRDRLESRGMGIGQGATGARNTSPMRRSSNVLAGTTRNAPGSKSVTAVITLFLL